MTLECYLLCLFTFLTKQSNDKFYLNTKNLTFIHSTIFSRFFLNLKISVYYLICISTTVENILQLIHETNVTCFK